MIITDFFLKKMRIQLIEFSLITLHILRLFSSSKQKKSTSTADIYWMSLMLSKNRRGTLLDILGGDWGYDFDRRIIQEDF